MLFACAICKGLTRAALCLHCAERLFARQEPVHREEKGFAISSLFTWERDGWLGLRWWIAALKQREDPRFWREPAIWALDTFAIPKRPPVLLPIPSTHARNHALGFARALALQTGWTVLDDVLTIPAQNQNQKKLDRFARQRRTYGLSRQVPLYQPLIVIDDVITTGATARAAFQALKRPKYMQVWCLMDRRPCVSWGALL
jgi:predicted amidophosphoribosyltransferase